MDGAGEYIKELSAISRQHSERAESKRQQLTAESRQLVTICPMSLRKLRSILLLLLTSIATIAQQPVSPPMAADALFTHARILDGTGNPWFLGDVAVKGDRIVFVG